MAPPQAATGSAKSVLGKTDTRMTYPTVPVLVNILFSSAGAVGVACHRIAFRGQCHPDRLSRETLRAECSALLGDHQCNSGGIRLVDLDQDPKPFGNDLVVSLPRSKPAESPPG